MDTSFVTTLVCINVLPWFSPRVTFEQAKLLTNAMFATNAADAISGTDSNSTSISGLDEFTTVLIVKARRLASFDLSVLLPQPEDYFQPLPPNH